MRHIAILFIAVSLTWACNNTSDQNNREGLIPEDNVESKKETNEEPELPNEVRLVVKTPGETMAEMRFEPARLEVAANAKVTIILKNIAESEAMIHNLVVIETGSQVEVAEAGLEAGPEENYIPDSPKIIAATDLAKPGEEEKIVFTAPSKKGTYQYICTYPGHTKMKGVLLVK